VNLAVQDADDEAGARDLLGASGVPLDHVHFFQIEHLDIAPAARQRVQELSRQKGRDGGLAAALAVLLSEETPLGESSIMTRAFLGEMFSAVKRQAREE